LCGVALGALLLNGAASIVVYLVASIAWGFVGLTGELGSTLARWFDLNGTTVPLADGEMSPEAVGPLLASIGLWVVVPFLLGVLRVRRCELRWRRARSAGAVRRRERATRPRGGSTRCQRFGTRGASAGTVSAEAPRHARVRSPPTPVSGSCSRT